MILPKPRPKAAETLCRQINRLRNRHRKSMLMTIFAIFMFAILLTGMPFFCRFFAANSTAAEKTPMTMLPGKRFGPGEHPLQS